MTFPQLPQAVQQDTTSAAADSLNSSLDRIGEGVTNTGRLILEGEWGLVWEQTLAGTTNLFVSSVPNILSALFVGAFFYGLYRLLTGAIRGVLRKSRGVDRGLETIVMRTFRVVAWGFILLLVLSQLGVNLSALIAGLGIAGLAVGFAAKDSLENFISGLTILLDRPFKVGDWVTVENYFGRVSNITLRSTRLETPNRQTVVFPSVHMVTNPVINHSARGVLRVDVPFGIAYKERIEKAREAVLALLDGADDRLAPDWEHKVVATKLNDSSVDLELRLFLRDAADQVPVRLDYIEKIRNALRDADIEIPFPHLQLFIDGADAPIKVQRVDGHREGGDESSGGDASSSGEEGSSGDAS